MRAGGLVLGLVGSLATAAGAQEFAPDAGCAGAQPRKPPKTELSKRFAARGVAAHASGRVFMTGRLALPPYGVVATVGLAADGAVAWTSQLPRAGDVDSGLAIDVDADANSYVTTNLAEAGLHEYVIAKYAPDGSETWLARIPDHVTGGDVFHLPEQIRVDTTGSVRVIATAGRFLTHLRLRPDGTEQWAVGIDPGDASVDVHRGIGLDAAGNSYFAYFEDRALVVAKVDAGGGTPWSDTIHPADIDLFTGGDLVADDAGNSWCACPFEARDGLPDASGVLLVKHDTAGGQVWTRRYDGLRLRKSTHVGDLPGALVASASGAVYLLGSELEPVPQVPGTKFRPPRSVAVLRKVDADGTLAWTRRIPSASLGSTGAGALTLDAAGRPVAVGSRVVSFDTDGRVRFDVPLADVFGRSYDWVARDIVPLAAGGLFVTGPTIHDAKPVAFVAGTVTEPASVAGGTAAALPSQIAFGRVKFGGPRKLRSLKLKNASATECLAVSLAPSAPFLAEGPFLLPPRGKLRVSVAFAPTAEGAFAETVVVRTSDPARPQFEVLLTGEGVTGN